MENYYTILGVARNATTDEIRAAYRRLAKQYHPDASGSGRDRDRFQKIQEAYAVLSDAEKRRLYNYYGHAAYTSSYAAQHGHAWYWGSESRERGHDGHGHEDGHCGACGHDGHGHEDGHCGACGHDGHGHEDGHCGACGHDGHGHDHAGEREDGHCGACFSEERRPGFGDFAGSSAAETAAHRFMHEVRVPVHITVDETFQENVKETVLQERLLNADGSDPGYMRQKVWPIRVKIPYGAYHEQLLPLQDVIVDGDELIEHLRSTYPWNYYNVIVILKDRAGYTRKGYHLYTKMDVDYCTLVLGGQVMVPTLHGLRPHELAPGTSPYQYVRLPGQGLIYPPLIGGRGDLYVYLNLQIPKELTPAQEAATRALQQAMQEEDEAAG